MSMGVAIFAIILTLVAGGATHCATLTRRDRNYWPMLRVLWAVLAFIYGGSGIAVAMNQRDPNLRDLIFASAALGAVGYSVWFMHRRNRLARFLGLTVGGDIVVRSVHELEAAATLTESWAQHGAMPAARAERLRAALAEWEAKRAWAAALAAEAKERRAAKERGG
jgi:hypothetical protein